MKLTERQRDALAELINMSEAFRCSGVYRDCESMLGALESEIWAPRTMLADVYYRTVTSSVCLRLIAPGDIDKIARQQKMLLKSGSIAFEPAFVFEPPLDKVERDLGQPLFGKIPAEVEVKYCQRCGTPMTWLERFGRPRPVCPQCDWTYFPDPKVAVAALVEREGQVLLVRRCGG